MNIIGIGTDLVAISRIEKMLDQYDDKIIARILSTDEQIAFAQTHKKSAFLAKRFAAKEAIAKALGTGIGKEVAFKEISIINLANGKPIVQLLGKSAHFLENREIMITLTDEKEYAQAFAIYIEK